MSETTILKASAINRNAPKSPAQLSGPLPVVQVSMTANGPQVSTVSGQQQARPVVVSSPKGRSASSGAASALPMVQVKMTPGGPQVNRSAVPPTSQPRGVARVAKIPPMQVAQVAQEQLTADQLMLCRHLVDKYLGELRSSVAADPQVEGAISVQEEGSFAVNSKLAEATIGAIDAAMLARTTAEAEAIVDAAAVEAAETPAEAVAPTPAPKRSAAPPPRVVVGPRSLQAGSAVTPRRVTRPQGSAPLPMVTVKMNGEKPVVVDPPQTPSDQPELSELPTELADESGTTQG